MILLKILLALSSVVAVVGVIIYQFVSLLKKVPEYDIDSGDEGDYEPPVEQKLKRDYESKWF